MSAHTRSRLLALVFAMVAAQDASAANETVCYFRNQDTLYASKKFFLYPSSDVEIQVLREWVKKVSSEYSVPTFAERDLKTSPNIVFRHPTIKAVWAGCMTVSNMSHFDDYYKPTWWSSSTIAVPYPSSNSEATRAGSVAGAVIGGLRAGQPPETSAASSRGTTAARERSSSASPPTSTNSDPSWAQILTEGAASIAAARAGRPQPQTSTIAPSGTVRRDMTAGSDFRAPLAPASCARYRASHYEPVIDSTYVEWRNICTHPIEVHWCWVRSGQSNCKIDNAGNTLSPGETQLVVGPDGNVQPIAAYYVCNMSDSSKLCSDR